jgi:hypothetical protein
MVRVQPGTLRAHEKQRLHALFHHLVYSAPCLFSLGLLFLFRLFRGSVLLLDDKVTVRNKLSLRHLVHMLPLLS